MTTATRRRHDPTPLSSRTCSTSPHLSVDVRHVRRLVSDRNGSQAGLEPVDRHSVETVLIRALRPPWNSRG